MAKSYPNDKTRIADAVLQPKRQPRLNAKGRIKKDPGDA